MTGPQYTMSKLTRRQKYGQTPTTPKEARWVRQFAHYNRYHGYTPEEAMGEALNVWGGIPLFSRLPTYTDWR